LPGIFTKTAFVALAAHASDGYTPIYGVSAYSEFGMELL